MKKLIHEQLEDLAFSSIKDMSRSEIYSTIDEELRKETIDGMNKIIPGINDALKERISAKLMAKDGWRAFAKPTCYNYMLAYNYMLGTLHRNGNKVFKVEADLAEALYHTDIEISVKDIRPPFNSFVVYIDGQTLKHIGEYSPPENPRYKIVQEYWVSYIMVEFLDSPYSDSGKIMRMVFGYYDPGTDSDDIKNWNNSTFLELDLEGSGTFKPKEGEKAGLGHFFPEQSLLSDEQKEKAKRYNEAIINFIFSLMLYIENKNDDVTLEKAAKQPIITTKNPKKARRQAKLSADESCYNIYHIGKKYSGAFQRSREQFSGNIDHKIIVRGHWRDQWYGRKSLLEDGTRLPGEYQKQIWIEPFFRGAEYDFGGKSSIYKVE